MIAETLFKVVHTYTWKVKFDRIPRMINEVNLQVFLLNSHSIITTFLLCRAACLDCHLNLQVQFERQLIPYKICEEPIMALLKGNHLILGGVCLKV